MRSRAPPTSEKRLAVTCVMAEVALMTSAFLMIIPVMVKFKVEWSERWNDSNLHCFCYPWQLDSGYPCQNDAEGVW